MSELASTRPGRPLLVRIGMSRLPVGFLLLPLLASTLTSRRVDGAPPSRFTAVNRSPYVIRAVYACPPRSPSWGANLIDGKALPPGQEVALELKDGCGTYDLRFVADDGIEFLEDGVAFCGADGAAAATPRPDDREDVITIGRDDLARTQRPRVAAPAAKVRR